MKTSKVIALYNTGFYLPNVDEYIDNMRSTYVARRVVLASWAVFMLFSVIYAAFLHLYPENMEQTLRLINDAELLVSVIVVSIYIGSLRSVHRQYCRDLEKLWEAMNLPWSSLVNRRREDLANDAHRVLQEKALMVLNAQRFRPESGGQEERDVFDSYMKCFTRLKLIAPNTKWDPYFAVAQVELEKMLAKMEKQKD